MQEFVNIHTGKTILREDAKDSEIPYDGKMMIVEMDIEGNITYTNRKFRDMVGYSREELIGLPFGISHHPDMPQGLCKQAFDTATNGKIWAGYIKSITKSGEYFWSTVCVQPKYDNDKNIIGYIINKKHAEDEAIEGVKAEHDIFNNSEEVVYRSEYCGELHNNQIGI